VRLHRPLLLCLSAAAVLVALVQGLTGDASELLTFAPLLLIATLLLAGRYPGERWIAARRRTGAPARAHRRERWARGRELGLAGLLERSPRVLRGPPAALAIPA
jgi:hypothetical protein